MLKLSSFFADSAAIGDMLHKHGCAMHARIQNPQTFRDPLIVGGKVDKSERKMDHTVVARECRCTALHSRSAK